MTPNGAPIEEMQAFPGRDVKITDGPVCKDGKIWLEVDFLGYKGWCMEVETDGSYYLRKTSSGKADSSAASSRSSSAAHAASAQKPAAAASGGDEKCRCYTEMQLGDRCELINATALTMCMKPNGSPMVENQSAFPGKVFTLTDGPVCVNGIMWWEIDFLGYRGWVPESNSFESYFLKK